MSTTRTLIIAELALAIALAVVLNFLQIRVPVSIAGGSINLSMLPLALVALRRGVLAGAVAGAAFGLFDLLLEPFVLVPLQVLLDYPLPYLMFGLGAGLFSRLYNKYALQEATGRFVAKGSLILVLTLICGGFFRLISHVVSGVVFFAEYYAADFFVEFPWLLIAGGPEDAGLNAWIYSTGYNLIYLVPSLVCVGICALILAPILAKVLPVKKRMQKERIARNTDATEDTQQ